MGNGCIVGRHMALTSFFSIAARGIFLFVLKLNSILLGDVFIFSYCTLSVPGLFLYYTSLDHSVPLGYSGFRYFFRYLVKCPSIGFT